MSSSEVEYLFGLKITFTTYKSLFTKIENAINKESTLTILYANFHTINLINNDSHLKEIINSAHVVHQDGIGMWLAAKLLKKSKIDKFNWTDNGLRFLSDCEKKGWSIFLIGSTDETLNKAITRLQENFPGLRLSGYQNGFDHLNSPNTFDKINSVQPDILWVGMGTPKQEQWIFNNREKLSCKVIQSVGDFITYLAGEKKRGFKVIRHLGLEWVIRVIYNPSKYFKRYIIGIPQFLFLLFRTKMKQFVK